MLFPHSTTCSEGVLILIPMLLPHATYCSNCLHEKTEQKRCSTWWANVRAGRNIFSSSHAVACCSLLQKGLFYFQRSFTFKTCQAEDRITRGLDSEGPRMFWKAPGSPNTQRTAYREAQLSLSALCRAVGLKRFEMVWVISGLGAAKVREGFLTTGSNAREPFCNCSRGTSAFIMLCGTLLHFALICFACLVQLVEYAESCWIQVRGFSRSPEQTGCDRGHLSPQPKSFRWRTQGAETEPQPTKPQTFQDVPPGFRHLPQDVLHSMISARKSFESFLTEIPTLWWTIITICWLSICFSAGTVILNCEIVKFACVEGCKRQEARETH